MASRTKIKTWITQNLTTFQATNVPPVSVPAVTVSVSEVISELPDAPPRLS